MDAVVLFRSTMHPEVFGFTMDITGTNLPNGFAPWLQAGRIPAVVEVAHRVKEAIVRDGFYLSRNGIAVAPGQEPKRSIEAISH
jgi:hypothetical protein